MSNVLDPHNSIAVYFYLRAGVHPAKAPEPPKPEPQWKEAGPDAAHQFIQTKRYIDTWFQR